MSAIVGIWRFDDGSTAEADCTRALNALELFGPHDGRHWSDGAMAMGRRLYRLLPEDAYDRQPLQSRDGRLTLVADLRLDNRDDLIRTLGWTQGEARQLCDAQVLLACLERWGDAAVDRLVGPFVFALWNSATQTLMLARDILGQRPLHFHRGKDFFAFASMPQGLHALPEVPCAPDERMVAEFLVLMPQRGTRTFFAGIEQVEAGHIVNVTRSGMATRPFWTPRRPFGAKRDSVDYVEGVRFHLDKATRSCLRGVSVVGSQLSGGFDSGAVTATAARLLASECGKVIAFTAVPREGYTGAERRNQFGNEGPLAAATAAMHSNVEHVLVRAGDRSPLDALDRNFFLAGAPVMGVANSVWAAAINDAARARRLKVMLVGTMGNMTLSYAGTELLPELLLKGHLIRLWRAASQMVAHAGMHWRGALVQTFGPFIPPPLWRRLNETFAGGSSDIRRYSAIRPDLLAELDLAATARERDLDFSYRPWKNGFAMRLWVMRRGGNSVFTKGQLAGWGLDFRDPTADKRLIEYCLSIPTEEYVKGGVQRSLARRALADRLPAAVLNERRKGHQAADWHEAASAARAEIAAELDRLAACPPATKTLDIARLKRLNENWPSGGWERPDVIQAYRLALLRGISAGHFLRRASGTN